MLDDQQYLITNNYPGARHVINRILNRSKEPDLDLQRLIDKGITGHRLYILYLKICNGNIDGVLKIIRNTTINIDFAIDFYYNGGTNEK